MKARSVIRAAALAAAFGYAGASAAAAIQYSFTTSADAFGGPSASGGFVSPSHFTTGASGTFHYDPAASAVGSNPNGSPVYRGYAPSVDPALPNSIGNLVATVGGRSIADLSGSTSVSNDRPLPGGGAQPLDELALLFDPSITNTTGVRNFTGFSIDGYTLYRIRMFWLEGQSTPDLVPDFLDSEALPSTLPDFSGRLALDFYRDDNPNVIAFVFFDGLRVRAAGSTVPAPGTLGLLGLGFVGLCLAVSRRPGRSRHA